MEEERQLEPKSWENPCSSVNMSTTIPDTRIEYGPPSSKVDKLVKGRDLDRKWNCRNYMRQTVRKLDTSTDCGTKSRHGA